MGSLSFLGCTLITDVDRGKIPELTPVFPEEPGNGPSDAGADAPEPADAAVPLDAAVTEGEAGADAGGV